MLSTLPALHRSFAEQLKLKFQADSRIHSLLAGGSFVHGGFDQYSDLDFVVVVDPLYYDEITAQRIVFAGTLGHLLHAFTGEHVGEPRLLSHAESRSPGLKGFGLFRPHVQTTFAKKWSSEFRL